MEILIILIIISVGIATGFLVAFVLSVKNKQFDDLYSPSIRVLFEKTAYKRKIAEQEYIKDMDKILEINNK